MGVRLPSGSLGKIHPLPAAEETLSIKMSTRFCSETGRKGLVATQLRTWGYRTCFGGPQLPLQNEDKPKGHKSLAAVLPPLKLNPTLSLPWEDKRKKEDSANQARANLSLAPVSDPAVQPLGMSLLSQVGTDTSGGAGKPLSLVNKLVWGRETQ